MKFDYEKSAVQWTQDIYHLFSLINLMSRMLLTEFMRYRKCNIFTRFQKCKASVFSIKNWNCFPHFHLQQRYLSSSALKFCSTFYFMTMLHWELLATIILFKVILKWCVYIIDIFGSTITILVEITNEKVLLFILFSLNFGKMIS